MRHYQLYMNDILMAMKAVQDFVVDLDYEEFVADDKTTSAVVHKLGVIGEATKNLPDSIRLEYPQIPWRHMAGMRDWIVHAYFKIDYLLVWNTVKDIIPPLQPIIEEILEGLSCD